MSKKTKEGKNLKRCIVILSLLVTSILAATYNSFFISRTSHNDIIKAANDIEDNLIEMNMQESFKVEVKEIKVSHP